MSKFIPCRFCGDDYFWNDGHECEGNRKPDQPIVDGFTECLEREYVNYCRKHPSKSIEFSMWQDAVNVGYAEGLKAGRADAVKFIEAAREVDRCWDVSDCSFVVPKKHTNEFYPNDSLAAGAIIELIETLAAFDKGRGDGTA